MSTLPFLGLTMHVLSHEVAMQNPGEDAGHWTRFLLLYFSTEHAQVLLLEGCGDLTRGVKSDADSKRQRAVRLKVRLFGGHFLHPAYARDNMHSYFARAWVEVGLC